MSRLLFKDLAFRSLFAGGAVAFLSIFLVFSQGTYFRWFFVFFVALLGALSVREFGKLAQEKGFTLYVPLMMGACFIEIFACFLSSQNFSFLPLALGVFFSYILFLFLLYGKKMTQAIAEISISCFPIFYIVVPLGLSFFILYHPLGKGRFWIFYLIAVTKCVDIGGYFGGKLWGKKKLAPQISPHKTISGAWIGGLCAILVSILFSLWGSHLSWKQAIWMGILLGFFAQIGDLFESLLKRDANLKDSSSIPGMGGFLDMIDSLIFNIFVVFFFLSWK